LYPYTTELVLLRPVRQLKVVSKILNRVDPNTLEVFFGCERKIKVFDYNKPYFTEQVGRFYTLAEIKEIGKELDKLYFNYYIKRKY